MMGEGRQENEELLFGYQPEGTKMKTTLLKVTLWFAPQTVMARRHGRLRGALLLGVRESGLRRVPMSHPFR